MKKIQHIAFTSVLVLALSVSAFAGDITVGKSGAITGGKAPSVAGDISVGLSGDITVGLLEILGTILSIMP